MHAVPGPGVYAWIGINFVLGRFDHADEGEWNVYSLITNQRPSFLHTFGWTILFGFLF